VHNLGYRINFMVLQAGLAWRRLLFQVYINKRKASLAGADLSFLDLSRLNLRRANLCGANLTRADLSRTNLRGANLEGANLTGTILRGANLADARLDNAYVTPEQLAQARSLQGTTMPDGTRHE
jgi:uncharacterized protein YjbI with pentapeptide repeats